MLQTEQWYIYSGDTAKAMYNYSDDTAREMVQPQQ